MMKNKRFLVVLLCGFFVVLILLFFTLRKQEIPLQYRGSWVLSVDKTIFYNRKDPVWKEEYEANLKKSQYVLGYRITSTSLGATFDGKGKMCPVRKLKINTASIEVVPDVPQPIPIMLKLLDQEILRLTSTGNQFPLLYERQKE